MIKFEVQRGGGRRKKELKYPKYTGYEKVKEREIIIKLKKK